MVRLDVAMAGTERWGSLQGELGQRAGTLPSWRGASARGEPLSSTMTTSGPAAASCVGSLDGPAAAPGLVALVDDVGGLAVLGVGAHDGPGRGRCRSRRPGALDETDRVGPVGQRGDLLDDRGAGVVQRVEATANAVLEVIERRRREAGVARALDLGPGVPIEVQRGVRLGCEEVVGAIGAVQCGGQGVVAAGDLLDLGDITAARHQE